MVAVEQLKYNSEFLLTFPWIIVYFNNVSINLPTYIISLIT